MKRVKKQSSSLPPDLQGDRTGGGGNGNRGRELSSSPQNRVSIQTSIPSSSPSQIMSHPIPSSPSHIPPSPTHPSSPSHSPVSPAGGVSTPLSQHPATPQTPLTPSVPLPRLVVTDQDGNDDKDLLLNEVSEFSSFIFDDYIFRNLSSLGEEELMSVDQILVDTETEESFRRDLRNPTLPQEVLPMDAITEQFLQEQLEASQRHQQQQQQQQHQHQQQQQQQQQQQVQRSTASTQTTVPVMHSPPNLPNAIQQQQQQQQQQSPQESHSQLRHHVRQSTQFINLKGSLIEEQEQLQKIPHHQQVNHPSSPSSNQPQQLSRSLETSLGLSSSPSQIMTLDPLDEVSESLLSYTTELQQRHQHLQQLEHQHHHHHHQQMPLSPTEFTNQLELELHSSVCPTTVSAISSANSPPALCEWQQISEPNPQL